MTAQANHLRAYQNARYRAGLTKSQRNLAAGLCRCGQAIPDDWRHKNGRKRCMCEPCTVKAWNQLRARRARKAVGL